MRQPLFKLLYLLTCSFLLRLQHFLLVSHHSPVKHTFKIHTVPPPLKLLQLLSIIYRSNRSALQSGTLPIEGMSGGQAVTRIHKNGKEGKKWKGKRGEKKRKRSWVLPQRVRSDYTPSTIWYILELFYF